jgi:hypothetical protein
MKTNQHTTYLKRDCNNSCQSFFGISKSVFAIKENFSFDVFQFLKAENEKLQIVYANIRV